MNYQGKENISCKILLICYGKRTKATEDILQKTSGFKIHIWDFISYTQANIKGNNGEK